MDAGIIRKRFSQKIALQVTSSSKLSTSYLRSTFVNWCSLSLEDLLSTSSCSCLKHALVAQANFTLDVADQVRPEFGVPSVACVRISVNFESHAWLRGSRLMKSHLLLSSFCFIVFVSCPFSDAMLKS